MNSVAHAVPPVQSGASPFDLLPPVLRGVLGPAPCLAQLVCLLALVEAPSPGPFPGHYHDEAPELADSDGFDPSELDEDWWAAQTRDGGWVEGEGTPRDLELVTDSALAWAAEHLDPGPEPEPEPTGYTLF